MFGSSPVLKVQSSFNMEERDKHEDKYLSSLEDIYSSNTTKVERTWRTQLKGILYSVPFHWVVIFLIAVDTMLEIATILIDFGLLTDYEAICNKTHVGSAAQKSYMYGVAYHLHYTCLAISCLFTVEVILRAVVLEKKLLRDCWEAFDSIVVVVCLAIDIAVLFEFVPTTVLNIISLVILLRLWRVTRIGKSAIVSVKDKAERQQHSLMLENKKLASRIRELEAEFCQKQSAELQMKLDARGNIVPRGALYQQFADGMSSAILSQASEIMATSKPPTNHSSESGSLESLPGQYVGKMHQTQSVLHMDERVPKKHLADSPGSAAILQSSPEQVETKAQVQGLSKGMAEKEHSSQGDGPDGKYSYENAAFELDEAGTVEEHLADIRQTVEGNMLEGFSEHYYTSEDGIPMTSL